MSSGWVRFENTTPDNLKVIAVSDRAFRLWFNASCFCSRGQTDGRIPMTHMPTLIGTGAPKAVRDLVDAGLLEVDGRDYIVHDYLEYNPSRVKIAEMRAKTKQRVSAHRGKPSSNSPCNGVTDPVTECVTDPVTNGDVTRITPVRDRSVPDRVVDVSAVDVDLEKKYIFLSEKLAAQIKARDPNAKIDDPRCKRWVDAMRLLHQRDNRSPEQINRVLTWLPSHAFWPTVVLSAPKFREKFTQLVAAMGANKPVDDGGPAALAARIRARQGSA